MTKTIKKMIDQARRNIDAISGLKHFDSQYQYWVGRLDGLNDALKAMKIELEWCKNDERK